MKSRDLQRRMYEQSGPSLGQRLTVAVLAASAVGLVWWLLFGGGLAIAGRWFGRTWNPGDAVRRGCLAAALTIYYLRILFTEFVFLKRGLSWNEAFTIASWIFCIFALLCATGGRNANPFGPTAVTGAGFFIIGSWMNSYAEYSRHAWKLRPENRGRLYTGGLFRWSRHPNYFGDLLSFSGLCLMSGAWATAAIPALMLAGFVFINVPVLDAHLRDKYGAAFDEYAARTRKLIPFVY